MLLCRGSLWTQRLGRPTTTTTTCRLRSLSSFSAWVEETVLQRPNPFIEFYQQQQQQQAAGQSTDNDTEEQAKAPPPLLLPPWNRLQPHHADKATARILQHDYAQILATGQQATTTTTTDFATVQRWWQQHVVQGPVTTYPQCLAVLALGTDPPAVTVEWQAAHAAAVQAQRAAWHAHVIVQPQEENDTSMPLLAQQLAAIDENNNDTTTSLTPAQQQWLRYWQDQTGANVTPQNKAEWSRWQTALYDIRTAWHDDVKKPTHSPRAWLPLWYSYLGCRQTLAQQHVLEMYPHAAAHAMYTRGFAQPDQLPALHEAAATRLVPLVMLASEQQHQVVSSKQQQQQLLTKQRVVSLDAALVVLQQLCADVFGVTMEFNGSNATHTTTWHPDVRVVHFQTNNNNNKSNDNATTASSHTVYLDLLGRPGKGRHMAATLPITNNASAVMLALEPPVWDTDPVLLNWHELLDLFHEMGHVLQQASAVVVDPSWPMDWAEVLPKFMEQWLWEPTTLQSLLVASGVEWDDETRQALYTQARRAKADDLARQAFFSATEWALLSDYNVQSADETVMALTQRLARQYIPHDVPHATDFSALYAVADANIRDGECAALYRYLWAETVAAHVFTYAKNVYQTQGILPQELLQTHLCQPSSWKELTEAFDMSADSVETDVLWERYQFE